MNCNTEMSAQAAGRCQNFSYNYFAYRGLANSNPNHDFYPPKICENHTNYHQQNYANLSEKSVPYLNQTVPVEYYPGISYSAAGNGQCCYSKPPPLPMLPSPLPMVTSAMLPMLPSPLPMLPMLPSPLPMLPMVTSSATVATVAAATAQQSCYTNGINYEGTSADMIAVLDDDDVPDNRTSLTTNCYANNADSCGSSSSAYDVKDYRASLLGDVPCQQQSQDWDYEQCYSYYAYGCYNTCQFVEMGDMEDFMNNEKRKEKSRFAARCRRSRETEIFSDLGSALPLPQDQVAQLDKASVMRLAISYLRVRDMIKLVPTIQKKKGKKIKTDESVFLKSLEGFVLVLSAEGDFVYVSENIAEYLGITQIDLMGQSVYEYSHPCDHDEIKDILSAKAQEKTDKPKSFFLRLKCTLTNKGRSVNLKSASYKVIHCTGHILHVNSDQKKPDGVLNKCFIAIGQPIPHPSNIEAPLPTQTFLTKHSLDMKFTYADDKMFEFLGYNSDDLIGKSLYEYHHAMDSDSVSSAYKCLFSKGQCETTRYRFLGKTGGFAWVLTQATLIQDKVNKPHSVVCVNYVISGVECQDEIYTSFQLTPSQTTTTATSASPPAAVVVEELLDESCSLLTPPPTSPSSVCTSSSSSLGSCEQPAVDSSLLVIPEVCVSPPIVAVVAAPAVRRPVTSTAKLFGGELPPVQQHQQQTLAPARQPQTATSKCFAPRTEEMSKGFLMFSDEEPGLTLLKDEPDDLTHLAPVAGDVCVPLDDNPCFASDMFMDTLLLRDFTLLTDEPCDPFMNSCDASPQLLSPNLSKTSDSSLHSLNSPSDSLTNPDDDHMFLNTPHTLDDDTEDADLLLKAPYIPMDADLPLFMSGDDLMWSSGNCANSNTTNCCNSSSASASSGEKQHSLQSALRGENASQQLLSNSSLAELLRSGVSKGSTRDVDAGGGGGVEMLGRGMTGEEYYESNGRPNSSCWQTATNKTTNRLLNTTTTVAPSIPTKRTGRYSTTPANKRPKNEPCDDSSLNNPNNKLPVELLHQLITMNSSRGGGAGKRLSTAGGNNSRGKQQQQPQQQQHWLLDTGGRHNGGNNSKAACCVSQPSDSVLMNLLVSGFDIRAGYICLAPNHMTATATAATRR